MILPCRAGDEFYCPSNPLSLLQVKRIHHSAGDQMQQLLSSIHPQALTAIRFSFGAAILTWASSALGRHSAFDHV